MHYKIQNRINLLLDLAHKHNLIDKDIIWSHSAHDINKIGLLHIKDAQERINWRLYPTSMDKLTDYLISIISKI